MRAELLVGIEALVLFHETDAVEIQPLDASFLVGRDLTAHVDERAAVGEAAGQRRAILVGAVRERATERRGRRLRVADFRRHRINRVGVDARRQHAALAIDDVAAFCRCVDRVHVLPFGTRDHVGALDDLQIHEPRFGAGDPHRQEDRHDRDPRLHGETPVRGLGWRRRSGVVAIEEALPGSHRRATTDGAGASAGNGALDHDRLGAGRRHQVQPLHGQRFDSSRGAQRIDLEPILPADLLLLGFLALHFLDLVAVTQQFEMLPRREQHQEHQQRGNPSRLPQLALPRLVHFTDNRIVAHVFLDGVFESFHVLIPEGLMWCVGQLRRSAALSLALRARGFRCTSSSVGLIGFLVNTLTTSLWARARNVCLTMRSSSE